MEPIHVLAPPKEAFNKNRRISDLIRAQINHLKHIEYKLPEGLRQAIPQHPIVTENDAALYIAAMTRLLRAQPVAAAAPDGEKSGALEKEGSQVNKLTSQETKVTTPSEKGDQ